MALFEPARRAVGAVVLTAALAISVSALAPGSATALTQEEIANLKGADRSKILLAGAKKEGEVSFYTTLIVNQVVRPLKTAFEKKYPGVKMNFVRLSSGPLLQRMLAESRAKSLRVDTIVAGGIASIKKAGILQPFSSPFSAGYPKSYVDPGKTYVAFYSFWLGIGWNTNKVKKADAPKTWQDLLNPKWKGKLVWTKSSGTGAPQLTTQLRKMWGEKKALEFIRGLKKQDIRTVPGSIRTALDQIAAGEETIGVNMAMHHIAISKTKGAPVHGITPEPAHTVNGYVGYIKGAPHPYAGMLLADFLMSPRDGQTVLRNSRYNPAHPKVEPLKELRWIQPNLNGKTEFVVPPEEAASMIKKSSKIYKDLFR